jgi:hypothetical protein
VVDVGSYPLQRASLVAQSIVSRVSSLAEFL